MKKFKKLSAMIMAGIMTLSFMTIGSFSAPSNSNSARSALAGSDITDIDETNIDFNSPTQMFNYSVGTRGVFDVGSYFDIYETLTTTDAIDFFPFYLSTAKSVVFRFLSENPNYAANLGSYDPSTGNVTTSNLWLYPGDALWTSYIPAGNYCWIVLNLGNTYGGQYRLTMNAKNPDGAIALLSGAENYSYVSFLYPGDVVMLNGMDVGARVNNFIQTRMETYYNGYAFRDKTEYTWPGGAFHFTNIFVNASPNDVNYPLYFGTYSSTIPDLNLENNSYHSTEHAVYIPLTGIGGSFLCTRSTSSGYTALADIPIGYLIYDAQSDRIIDWASPQNIYYSIHYNYSFSGTMMVQL